jgi:hypothetical protein
MYIYIYIYIFVIVCKYVYVCMYVCMYERMHVCVCVHACKYACMCVWGVVDKVIQHFGTCIQAAYTYMHARMHAHKWVQFRYDAQMRISDRYMYEFYMCTCILLYTDMHIENMFSHIHTCSDSCACILLHTDVRINTTCMNTNLQWGTICMAVKIGNPHVYMHTSTETLTNQPTHTHIFSVGDKMYGGEEWNWLGVALHSYCIDVVGTRVCVCVFPYMHVCTHYTHIYI